MHGLALLVGVSITQIIKNKYFTVDSLSVMLTELTRFVEKKNISPASSGCTFILEIKFLSYKKRQKY